MRVLAAAALYFVSVFVVAFALGAVRTFWLEPRLGETWAVACEAPLLILTMVAALTYVVPRAKPPHTSIALASIGVLALLFQQAAEFGLVLAAGETLSMHIAYLRTPAGMIYLATLAMFALLPSLLLRRAE